MGIYTEYIYITGLLRPQDNITAFYLTIIMKLTSTEILQCVDFCFRCDNLGEKMAQNFTWMKKATFKILF